MKVFYDTEFLEDGRTIDLISIGMVAEDGRELYLVNDAVGSRPLHERICNHKWLMGNVVRSLPLAPRPDPISIAEALSTLFSPTAQFTLDMDHVAVVPTRVIRNQVRQFILDTPDVELWADYGAYDHVVLAQLWGPMVKLPDGIPMWTHDLRHLVEQHPNVELPEQVDGHHNALADARHVRTCWETLTGGAS